ncbi:integrase [Sphingobacterium sp. CZ-UAM]|nr:integrase [Sphingobacterium sp. CZ-UAM]
MARSVFYYHLKRLNNRDKYKNEKEEIIRIYHLHKGRYGYRRVTAEMKNLGYHINHKTVQRLMGTLNLKCNIRKVRYRSYKGEVGRIAPNVLERNFKASLPNQKWATDVTQVNIKGEKIYLSPILDLFNGEVISYSISKSPNMQMIDEMLHKAFDKVKDTKGLIFHSDQGWQYQHYGYRETLEKQGIIQSMSRKGNCLDNAVAENFFGILKTELLYSQRFETAEEFILSLEEYIHYYNNKRIKNRLNGKSPVEYRALVQKT